MPNYPLLSTGQQAVTASAQPLPALPSVPGTGYRVILEALKANSASVFYGTAGVTDTTGKELAPGNSDTLEVNNLNMIHVVAAATGGSVSWVANNL